MHALRYETLVGAIVGGALGDVLGGIAERGSLSISDDTQLTLATCEAIIKNGVVSPNAIAQQMLSWFLSGRVTGIGSSTLKAMRDLEGGAHWALAGARGERAAWNGAAMRIAPVAFHLNPAAAHERRLIRDIARITHHHEEAYVGALAVVLSVRAAATGRALPADALAAELPDSRVRDYLVQSATCPGASLNDIARQIGTSGFTPETIAIAVALVGRMRECGFEAAMYELNKLGGDTDTIGSIAGQIVGTLVGADNLPVRLLDSVPHADDVKRIAERFAAATLAA